MKRKKMLIESCYKCPFKSVATYVDLQPHYSCHKGQFEIKKEVLQNYQLKRDFPQTGEGFIDERCPLSDYGD